MYPRCLRITQQAKRGWQRKVKREREAEWSQSNPKLYGHCSLQDVRTRRVGWGDRVSLFGSTASSSFYHHHHHPPHWCQEVGCQREEGARRGGEESSWRQLRDTGVTSSRLGHKHTHQQLNQASLSVCQGEFIQSSLFKVWSSLVHSAGENDAITNALRSETTSLCPPLRGLMQLVRTENILWNIAKSVPKIKGLIST